MNTFRTICLTVAVFAAPAAFAGDAIPPGNDGFTEWGKSGDWVIFIDNERQTCLAEKFDEERNAIQIGLTKDDKNAYLGLFTPLTDANRGQEADVTLQVGELRASSKVREWETTDEVKYIGTYVEAESFNFADDHLAAQKVIIYPDEVQATTMSLDGIGAALTSARECNALLKS